jgi:hypothetical protein
MWSPDVDILYRYNILPNCWKSSCNMLQTLASHAAKVCWRFLAEFARTGDLLLQKVKNRCITTLLYRWFSKCWASHVRIGAEKKEAHRPKKLPWLADEAGDRASKASPTKPKATVCRLQIVIHPCPSFGDVEKARVDGSLVALPQPTVRLATFFFREILHRRPALWRLHLALVGGTYIRPNLHFGMLIFFSSTGISSNLMHVRHQWVNNGGH